MGTSKTKDNMKARKDIEILCHRPILNPVRHNNLNPTKNRGDYTLKKDDVKKVELTSYVLEFDEVAPELYPNERVSGLRDKYFATWFDRKVMFHSSDGSAKHLQVLATKPSPDALSYKGYFHVRR
ncbi:hypothetical protein L2E82_43045 [Cichorium intybus]|uniref:Uncharacterized protein n=1 Tax=Cichorium intybus TaxID=13427 RepID=A0ACB8ZP94_CICIN|nr:hypothetical protein L2E82_43045 [Cichorium intybus]